MHANGVVRWEHVPRSEMSGVLPSSRAAHSFTVMIEGSNTAVIFGGRDKQGRRDDTHILQLDTMSWSGPLDCLEGEGSRPPPRSWHAAAAVDGGRRVLVQGGMSADVIPPAAAHQAGAAPGVAAG